MIVKNLVAWAGPDFSCLPGEEIDLPDDVATARVEAGLCAWIEQPKAKGRKNNNDDNNNG